MTLAKYKQGETPNQYFVNACLNEINIIELTQNGLSSRVDILSANNANSLQLKATWEEKNLNKPSCSPIYIAMYSR